eukprot:516497-Prymnesium_polylepis.1
MVWARARRTPPGRPGDPFTHDPERAGSNPGETLVPFQSVIPLQRSRSPHSGHPHMRGRGARRLYLSRYNPLCVSLYG